MTVLNGIGYICIGIVALGLVLIAYLLISVAAENRRMRIRAAARAAVVADVVTGAIGDCPWCTDKAEQHPDLCTCRTRCAKGYCKAVTANA